jgi:hypothetical protein
MRWNSLIDMGIDTGGALFGFAMVIGIRKLLDIRMSTQG